MSLLSELSARWKTESPLIFKKITDLGVRITAASTAVLLTPAIPFPNFHVPDLLTKLAGYGASIGFSIAVISKLTCKDPTTNDTK